MGSAGYLFRARVSRGRLRVSGGDDPDGDGVSARQCHDGRVVAGRVNNKKKKGSPPRPSGLDLIVVPGGEGGGGGGEGEGEGLPSSISLE